MEREWRISRGKGDGKLTQAAGLLHGVEVDEISSGKGDVLLTQGAGLLQGVKVEEISSGKGDVTQVHEEIPVHLGHLTGN